MKRTLFPWGLALLLVFSVAQLGLAQSGDGGGRGFGNGPGSGCGPGMCQEQGFAHCDGRGILAKAEALELTAEQIGKIKSLSFETAKAMIRLRSDLEVKQLELREIMNADRPDQAKIEAKIDEMAPLKTALQKKRIGEHLAMKNILTPEQKEKLESFRRSERDRKREPRHGHRDSERE